MPAPEGGRVLTGSPLFSLSAFFDMPTLLHPKLKLEPARNEHLDISALATWLWDAACAIRGATDGLKFKDFILPLLFNKRLPDVFDDEFSE